MSTATIIESDCLEVLRRMPDNSVDSIVTDPPGSILFMGCQWDSDKGGKDKWISWLREIAEEMLRVVKPGGHALVWALPRTSHWTATAIEDAGFEIRDVVDHLFGQGFPKSLDVSKAIDRAAGATREVVGYDASRARPNRLYEGGAIGNIGGTGKASDRTDNGATITAPATEASQQWEGFGTALKPAAEFWILARKPLSESTVAANVLKWGTGALNIDGCRVNSGPSSSVERRKSKAPGESVGGTGWTTPARPPEYNQQRPGEEAGRWPAHLVLSHDENCVLVGTEKVKGSRVEKPCPDPEISGHKWGTMQGNRGPRGIGDENNEETVEVWACVPGCPVRMLDDQAGVRKSGTGAVMRASAKGYRPNALGAESRPEGTKMVEYGDSGGASRFFYTAKASRSEREAGLLGKIPCAKCGELSSKTHKDASGKEVSCVRDVHPTIKPLELMRWLCRLVTPPGGKILDPFMGSGSTGCAALLEGFDFVGIDKEHDYCMIAKARIEHAAEEASKEPVKPRRGKKESK